MIAIDVGYSHVKAVTPTNRLIIPSVVSPYKDLPLADLSKNGTGYVVEICYVNGDTSKYFVGDMALKEGHVASFSLDREKHHHPNHDILVFTAARGLNSTPGDTLVAGLPVAYYRTQKKELQEHLQGLHAEVSINGQKLSRISFGNVIIYPQGAGSLLTAPELPRNGMVLLIDVGQKTTDYVTAELANGKLKPISSLCGSIEVGVHNIYDDISQEFQSRTGMPLAIVRVPGIIEDNGMCTFYGKEMNFRQVIEKAQTETARIIADQVQASLGDRLAFIKKIYLTGGGVEMLPSLSMNFAGAEILPNPQWANADGFLSIV